MTLLELLSLLRQKLALTIGLPVACALLMGAYCWGFMPNEYTAETAIYALATSNTSGRGSANEEVTATDLSASQILANDFAELVKNEQLQSETAGALGLDSLRDYDISVVSSTTTRVIKVSVTGTDSGSVALVANKLAEELGETAVRIMNIEAVNIINEAKTPVAPSGPRRSLYTAVAFMAGLFAAVAIVVIMDMLNTSVRSDVEAEELLEAPIIGRFPVFKGGSR